VNPGEIMVIGPNVSSDDLEKDHRNRE